MSSATDDLLAFKDFDDIAVNQPKKVINDGKNKLSSFPRLYANLSNFFFHSESPSTSPKVSMFQIEYYQQFFNIDTNDVVERIANSMIPNRATSTYLKSKLEVNPDLYGPFWITTTLIFTIAISGNLANFFQHDHNSPFHWHYNFHLVSYASTCIILYVSIMPFLIWSVLKYSVDLSDDENPDLESVSGPYSTVEKFY